MFKTKVVNIRNEPCDVKICRPSIFGNQWVIGKDGTRDEVIEKYKMWLYEKVENDKEFKREVLKLKNSTLGCFCRPENRCHGDIIQEYIDGYKVLAVIGSRNFNDYNFLVDAFEGLGLRNKYSIIVSGGAKGADALGKRLSYEKEMIYLEFPADWNTLGRKAGMVRNQDIIRCSDAVLCFWDGESKGTANSLSIAKRMKKPTFLFYF